MQKLRTSFNPLSHLLPIQPRTKDKPVRRTRCPPPRLIAAATLAVMAALPAVAEDFSLDARYADADGDLVADTPTDPAALIDPDTLIFAYTPVEDPSVYVDVWQEFLDHLSDTTGKPVEFFPVQSNAAQYEALRAGRLHIAGVNTGGNPIAVGPVRASYPLP